MAEYDSFDEITLEYAMKRNILDEIDQRLGKFCVYFLERIDSKIERKCKEFSNRHKGCIFELDDSYHDDDWESKVSLRYMDSHYVNFTYGFDYGIKVKNNNAVKPSKEGCDFCIYLEFLPKILGTPGELKKYYKNLEKYFTDQGLTAHENDDDDDIYFYKNIISIDKNYLIDDIIKEVEKAFNSLFKSKKSIEVFIDTKKKILNL